MAQRLPLPEPTGQLIPVGLPSNGINARDPLSRMAPTDAIDLVNIVSNSFGCSVRKGYQWYAYDLPGDEAVPTVMSYYPATVPGSGVFRGTRNPTPFVAPASVTVSGQLFACTNLNIYDITLGGGGPWAPMAGVGAVVSDFWTWRNFQNAGGNFIAATNDEGAYIVGGGTGFSSSGFSAGFSTGFGPGGGVAAFSLWARVTEGPAGGQIQNINPDLFTYLVVWKRRMWFVEKNSTRAWYLPVEQLTGEAHLFDFGSHFRHGGKLVALVSWTLDGGEGIDDYLVAIGSEGDIVIFKGYDPDAAAEDPAAFQLHGIWYGGPLPAGSRQVDTNGGDVYILTMYGVITLSSLVAGGPDKTTVGSHELTAKIDPLVNAYMKAANRAVGWYGKMLPREELFIIGLPQVVIREGVGQLALNANNFAWSRFADLPFAHFTNHDGLIFAGGDPQRDPTAGGKVYLAFDNTVDNVAPDSDLGTPALIRCRVIPSYSALGSPGSLKRIPMIRPTFLTDTIVPALSFAILADYQFPRALSVPTLPQLSQALWDVGLWDVSKWGGSSFPVRKWLGAKGAGFAITAQLDFLATGAAALTNLEYWAETGGVL